MRHVKSTDHLGHTFDSKTEMCKYWNIPERRYESRIALGWSVEDALTLPKQTSHNTKNNIWTDHKGNTFKSMNEMADYWHIPESTLQRRLTYAKMPIEEALTFNDEQIRLKYTTGCIDHLGNRFKSKQAMCEFYGVTKSVYFGRIGMGWSLKDALTTPLQTQIANAKTLTYKGISYTSISKFCKDFNLTRSTFNLRCKQMRKKYHCDDLNDTMIDEILSTPTKDVKIAKQECVDFKGNKFPSIGSMCKHYGISRATYSSRIEDYGWTQEKALTTPIQIYGLSCEDGFGNIFPTIVDLCYFYNIPSYTFQGKHASPEDIREFILNTKYSAGIKITNDLVICHIIDFPYFQVRYNGKDMIMKFDDILIIQHENFYPIPNRKTKIPLTITKYLTFPNYQITINNKSEIWDYWKIINYIKDNNYGLSKKET